MTHVRPGSAMRRASEAGVGCDDQPMPSFRGRGDRPASQIPRLVRKPDALGNGGAPPGVPEPLPRGDARLGQHRPAGISREAFRASPLVSRPRGRGRAGLRLRPVIVGCLLGMATGAGISCLLDLAAPQTAARLGVSVRHAVSPFVAARIGQSFGQSMRQKSGRWQGAAAPRQAFDLSQGPGAARA